MNDMLSPTLLGRILLILGLPLAFVAGAFHLAGKTIEASPPARPSITGYGEGRVSAKPDTAKITLGVQTGRQPTAEQAMQTLTQRMDAVLKRAASQGIEAKDITTTNISLYPAYDWIDGQQIAKGFEASQNIVLTVRDIAKVGQTVTSSTQAGANQVMGVQFYIHDVTDLRREARRLAIERAKADAERFAGDMSVRLGRLSGIAEQGAGGMEPVFNKGEGYGGGGGGDVPAPAGEQELSVSVAVTYDLR